MVFKFKFKFEYYKFKLTDISQAHRKNQKIYHCFCFYYKLLNVNATCQPSLIYQFPPLSNDDHWLREVCRSMVHNKHIPVQPLMLGNAHISYITSLPLSAQQA